MNHAPAKSNAPLTDGALQRKNEKTNEVIVADSTRFATLAARYHALGHALCRLPDGELYTTRWNRVCFFGDLDAAEKFLDRIGGSHGLRS